MIKPVRVNRNRFLLPEWLFSFLRGTPLMPRDGMEMMRDCTGVNSCDRDDLDAELNEWNDRLVIRVHVD